jgi:DNA-binding LacI/PurR family transcriptional regulator
MVDGILFMPCTDNLVTGESFQKFRTPLVSIDRRLVNVEVDTVEVDYERASYQATEHLIGLGHRVFSYIDRPYEQQHSILRKKGFWKAIKDHRADPKQQHILRADGFDYKDGARALDSLLQLDPKPTAVIVFNDIVAIGLLFAAIRRGFTIPRDLSIIGYGDIPVAKYLHPSLTTVSYPTQKIAAVASELILERINEPLTRAAKTIKVFNNHMLQVRETTEQLLR